MLAVMAPEGGPACHAGFFYGSAADGALLTGAAINPELELEISWFAARV
ncbi:hypothetical protein MNBD_DELTA03-1419, partial [hydrothermal vent metagenome]